VPEHHAPSQTQLERLTAAYLARVVSLEEDPRRRQDVERRAQGLAEQQRHLEMQVDRRRQLAGVASGSEDFCRRVRHGLSEATFAQKRQLIELVIDRVIVTDSDIEIRYVVPPHPRAEQTRFCHLRLTYRAGSSSREAGGETAVGVHHRSGRRAVPSRGLKSCTPFAKGSCGFQSPPRKRPQSSATPWLRR
jgi:hypothetical protein